MSHKSLHESLQRKDWKKIVLDLVCANERLEARIVDLERKLHATRVTVVQVLFGRRSGTERSCHICGTLGDEPCDAGLHG